MTQKNRPSFAEIVAGLQSSESKTRIRSIVKINQLKDEEIDKNLLLPILLNILENDEDIEVKADAATRLGFLGYREAVEPLMKAAQSQNSYLREKVLFALPLLQDESCLPILFDATKSKSSSIRERGIVGLYQFRNEQVFQVLLDTLENDPAGEVKEAAAFGLGLFNDSRAIDPLLIALEKNIGALADGKYTSSLRGEIARTLSKSNEPKVFDIIVALLEDPDKGVQEYVISALGDNADERVKALLLNILTDTDKPSFLRMEAAESLGKRNNREAEVITALIDATKVAPDDQNPAPLAQQAAWTLLKLGEPGLNALLETAQSSNNYQRSQALYALSSKAYIYREDARVIKTLCETLDNPAGLTARAIQSLKEWEAARSQPAS